MKWQQRSLSLMVLVLIGLVSLMMLARWSPWLSESYAKKRTIGAFEQLNAEVSDGCGFNCEDCGVKSMWQVPFGRKVWLEYNCGGPYENEQAQPPNFTTTAFVSFWGKVTIEGVH
ncbi:hypothetical protein [Paenibacillus daejeonensis]|uniref:hypothetical protein n=1 Tax=Paenibacillus daejeonensis TaxID=135193 RepID=UPI00035EF5FA|nr:hypothetical protein [Paenibacillus daejeonensis]